MSIKNGIFPYAAGFIMAAGLLSGKYALVIGIAMVIYASCNGYFGLQSARAKVRKYSFKSSVAMISFGILLIWLGACVGSPQWENGIGNPEAARSAISSLFVLCLAVLGAPAMVWAYLCGKPKTVKRIVRNQHKADTLSKLADSRNHSVISAAV